MQRPKCRTFLLLALIFSAAAQQPVFHSGTRLVEVDFIIRDKHGPVAGLTKDDFTLYDCKGLKRAQPPNRNVILDCKDKRQPIEVFREVSAASFLTAAPAIPLPPGAVSNRLYSGSEPLNSATVVVIDQLNTPFDLKGYQRQRVGEMLKSMGDKNRIAVYSLGRSLHILQDFTNDPQKLVAAMAKLDSGDQVNKPVSDGGGATEGHGAAEIAAAEEQVYADTKTAIGLEAIQTIIQHMQGVPGRKNLIWIAQGFSQLFDPMWGPPKARLMLGQANIAVYPVMVRSLQPSGILGLTTASPAASGGRGTFAVAMTDLQIQFDNRRLGETLGGTGFGDAADALTAVRAADEDSKSYYVLGFYPAEADLDGGTHEITVEVAGKALSRKPVDKGTLDLHYRRVYLANKPGAAGEPEKLSLLDILRSPLDSTAIGLTAAVAPGSSPKAGARQVEITVNLADVQLRREGDRWVGSLQAATRLESTENSTLMVTPQVTQDVPISLTDAELEAKKTSGLRIVQPLQAEVKAGSVHVAVQDQANGTAGSVRVPIAGILE